MNKFLYVLSKGFENSSGATRAMQFAALTAEAGHYTEVFLLDDAIHWAQWGIADGIYASTGEHMKDLLNKLLELNAPVHVCKACADKRLVGPDDLINGTVLSGAPVLVKMMTNPEYKVFTF